MIDMRSLKNFVIFIQTILSFMLSRKIIYEKAISFPSVHASQFFKKAGNIPSSPL